ncbi:MAG: TetR/AcrR family transcriptional regulator [Oscillospiraceae bacterium]|nr:TetR/AcrR family transcriptional regulator [Oscillospiraceae bacterium]
MTKAESKYFNTARKMDEAFLALIEKKDFEYITVKEICEKAGVNRSTFYLHYETIGDLLSECVEQMNQQFLTYFKETSLEFQQRIRTASLEQLFLITPEQLIPYLTYISDNRTVFKVVLAKPEVMQADRAYATLYRDILDPILKRYEIPAGEREYVLSFYIDGMMGIVKRWLQSDCKDSIDDIARIMMVVVRR